MAFLFVTLVFLFALFMIAAAAEAVEERRRLRIRGVRIVEPRRVVRTGVSRYVVAMPSKTQKRKGRGGR
jgi:hypothetical protein